jgi:small subunit ribosomal protein S13
MTKVKGVGYNLANVICKMAGIDTNKKAGTLTDPEIKMIERIIQEPAKVGVPTWMLNRQRDYETNEDKHVVLGDLTFAKINDIKREQKNKSYIGMRHSLGLPVRGQRTQSNFRKNKGKAVGGKKKTSIRK